MGEWPMGLLRRINNRLVPYKETEVKAVSRGGGNVPLSAGYLQTRSLQIDFESITKWAYRNNELVYSCIGERGRALREAPLRVYDEKNDKWLDGHPVETLLKQPNPFRSQAEFWEAVEQHLLLTGNAFIYKVRTKGGEVVELWLKKPDQIKVVPHPTKFISHYIYTVGGKEYKIAVEDIIHLMYIDPDNDYYGIAPLVAAAKKVDADSELGKFMKYILLNMATTSGVFVTDKKLGPDERQILEDKMAARYIGAIRAGLPMVLSHGMKYEQTSMNMKDLEIGNMAAWIESRICLALHVPAIVVGAKVGLDRSTFTNVREAREYMYENTISPEADLWERVDQFEGLSIIEKRVKIGYPADPEGIVYMDANKVPVDINTGEGLTPREPDPDLAETPAGQDPEEEDEKKKRTRE
jgi:HK97 family phage portal protein